VTTPALVPRVNPWQEAGQGHTSTGSEFRLSDLGEILGSDKAGSRPPGMLLSSGSWLGTQFRHRNIAGGVRLGFKRHAIERGFELKPFVSISE
jgi:hypothetical protein